MVSIARLRLSILSFSVFLLLAACSQRTVTRMDPSKQIDLSGRWNDSDSRMVANQMVSQFLNSPRYREYATEWGKRPAIIVGYIQNKTSEHIDAENFVKRFELEIFNSGLADLVESRDFRETIREERADQQEFATPETAARWGRETGAQLMLFGVMSSETDVYRNRRVVNYIITLYLTDIETTRRIWYGQEEIKKYIEN
jgi:penicillin-binding protein activator